MCVSVCVEMQQKVLFAHLTWRILYFRNVVAILHTSVSKLRLQLQLYIKLYLAEQALSLNLIYALVEAL